MLNRVRATAALAICLGIGSSSFGLSPCFGQSEVRNPKLEINAETLFGLRAVEGFPLLLVPNVQKELAMTRAQILRTIARDQAAEGMVDIHPIRKPEDIQILTKKQQEIRERAVEQILDEKQRARLLQILAQQQGAPLLLRKEIEQALGFTDTQRYVLYSIHKETLDKIKSLKPGKRGDRASAKARHVKLNRLRLAGYNHMLRALTPEQRKQLRGYLGRPVSLE